MTSSHVINNRNATTSGPRNVLTTGEIQLIIMSFVRRVGFVVTITKNGTNEKSRNKNGMLEIVESRPA